MRRSAWCWMVVLATGCVQEDWGPDQLGEGRTSPAGRNVSHGRELYGQYCVGCHGEEGDGEGPAARFLDPKPRDLRLGKLKFAGVAAGEPPRDEDYLRTIERGLHGTAMPSFALLTDGERRALVAYVRELVDPAKKKAPGSVISIPKDPWAGDANGAIAEGKKVFHTNAKCWSCHPSYASKAELTTFYKAIGQEPELRPNPTSSVVTESSWGAPIKAPDFTVDRIKSGIELEGLVRTIQAGVGGTAMPTWAGALKPSELWGLAYYVRSLALTRRHPGAVSQEVAR
jgi:mono/diheme cytochrome c family protein